MSKPLLLSLGNGKVQELVGGTNDYVPVWNASTQEWYAAPSPGGGGGSGTVTSVGLTGGTSGLVIGGTASPILTSGTFNIDAPLVFAFNTATPGTPVNPGEVAWNATEGSLNTLMAGGNVDAIVGQQLYQRVVNNDTVTLTKGMVVYVDGSSGTRVTVKRAIANADLSSATILGVVAESIAQNAEGFIITEGRLKDLSVLPSTSFTDGDVVYLSPTTPGALTATKPTAPQHLVMVGYCVKASNGAAGVLLVKTQNGYELGELHDVYINSPTSGQILIYDATSGQTRWENASLGAGSGIVVTPGPGSLSVALDPTYAPTFLGLALSGLSASQFVKTDASKNLVSQQYVSLTSEVSGTLPVGNGGTGKTTVTAGTLLLGAGASALTELAGSSANDVVKWNGSAWVAGAVPAVTSVSTVDTGMGLTLTTVNGTTTPTITLAGTLAASKGGTGTDLSGATGVVKVTGGVFSAAAILNGDISASAEIARSKIASANSYRLVANAADGHLTEVASLGTSGQVLTSTGAGGLPTWADASAASFGSQTANTVLAAPNGSAGVPSFRALVEADIPSLSGTYLPLAGGTLTGKLTTAASSATIAGFNLPHGAAPSTTVADGDIWTTSSGLFARISGVNQQLAPLASPAFTGSPTAPTPSTGDNDTSIATTAFVTTAVANAVGSPYDLSGDVYGALSSAQTVFRFLAPRNLTLTALTQGGGATATVQVQVGGTPVSAYPQSVTTGQLISVVTTSSGTDAYFTITGKVA